MSRLGFYLMGASAVLGLVAAAPTADAKRSHCPTANTVVRGATGLVFTRRSSDHPGFRLYYGCLWRTKKIYRLGQHGDFGNNQVHSQSIRLAGRFVAYEQDWGSGAGSALNTISVRDLRSGVVIHQAEVSRRGADFGDNVTDVVLKRSGSVAWIARTFDQDANLATSEVRAMTDATRRDTRGSLLSDAPLLLDDGPSIGLTSLSLAPDRRSVLWRHGAERRAAALP
jgi:hypothetical protein